MEEKVVYIDPKKEIGVPVYDYDYVSDLIMNRSVDFRTFDKARDYIENTIPISYTICMMMPLNAGNHKYLPKYYVDIHLKEKGAELLPGDPIEKIIEMLDSGKPQWDDLNKGWQTFEREKARLQRDHPKECVYIKESDIVIADSLKEVSKYLERENDRRNVIGTKIIREPAHINNCTV